MVWLRGGDRRFDVIVVDFPDPSHYSIGKLYSDTFYRIARRRLAPGGVLVVQASSPFFGRKSFWCIVSTLESAGFAVRPYHAYVPSFGDWGFALAKAEPFLPPERVTVGGLRFVDDAMLAAFFRFPKDMSRVPTEVNRLNNQALVGYYVDDWMR
jgi:spermidine synthase